MTKGEDHESVQDYLFRRLLSLVDIYGIEAVRKALKQVELEWQSDRQQPSGE